jgi:hypothetical protein
VMPVSQGSWMIANDAPGPRSAIPQWPGGQATTHCLVGCGIGEVLGLAIAVAWFAALPVNRWVIAHGRGHAVVHGHY